jgi:beta-mannosidase
MRRHQLDFLGFHERRHFMKQLDLSGTWRIRWTDGQRGRANYAERDTVDEARYIDAQVPGEVHLDVQRAGWIEDPYVGTNVLSARWVEEMIWSYRREFQAPPEALAGGRSWLVFERLDLAAVVVLNGVEIARHANSFYPCRVEVTGKLRSGVNVLAVHCDGGLFHVSEKPGQAYCSQGDHPLHKRSWLRKPQCQFSWDWSPRLINVGITGPVRLEWTDKPLRVEGMVPLVTLSRDFSTGYARVRMICQGLSPSSVAAELSVELPELGVKAKATVEVKPGPGEVELTATVPAPELWWPVGHGAQKLYQLKASLAVGGQVLAEREAQVGFRHVRVNQDPHPVMGRYFIIEINGRRIFCKGGNFVPADMIFVRLDRERYDVLTDRALEANFNMLRVWGGGLYESDDFYELCDRKGILVWQEFIFACSRYPTTDPDFLNSVREEARYNIRRLATHPSLVVWCGNNEMEWGSWDWGYDKNGATLPDYALFHLVLPRLLAQEDPTRYYQPSSPYSPDGLHPTSDHVGDQHPWSVGFHDTDFRKYRGMFCRFPNEGGILGPTALPTMLACLPQGQQFPGSFAWQIHENSVDSWAEPSPPDEMIRNWLGRDPRKMTIEEFTYWAGLVQGEGLREYVDNFRRRMFDTSSAIFWMYNDTWPATRSWTIVDYYLRRTPAFWPVKRAMAPVSVVVAVEGETVNVYGVNETSQPLRCELRYGVMDLDGHYPLDERKPAELAPNASTRLAQFPAGKWVSREASAAFAMLLRDGELVARNRLFEPLLKDVRWPAASVKVSVEGSKATFRSDVFAWGVCLDLDGQTPLADNFFDVWPGVPHVLDWPLPQPPKIVRLANGR